MGGTALCWGGDVRTLSDVEARGPRLWGNCSGLGRLCVRSNSPHLLQSCDNIRRRYGRAIFYVLTTLPGFRLDLLQVEVSVVQQLKHRLRILSLSLVVASSVYMALNSCCLG
jgi:hypothetical protein